MSLRKIALKKIVNYILCKYETSDKRIEPILNVMETECLTKESLDYNRLYLYKILKHAYKNVPYYSANYKILEELTPNNVYDVIKKLPLLSKDIILRQKENIYVKNFNKSEYGWMNTGGSTGEPLSFPTSYNYEQPHQKALYKYITGRDYNGYLDISGKLISFDGTKIPQNLVDQNIYWVKTEPNIYGTYNFSSFELNQRTYKAYLIKLNQLKPSFFRGYTSTITDLAKYILDGNEVLEFQLSGIYLTSENVNPEDMELLKLVFKCPVVGQYGHSEVSVFAWSQKNSLKYHFSPFYGYTEILDKDGNDVKEGEIGEIVVTGFSNKPLPFIRYRTGDLAVKSEEKNESSVLFTAEKLMGRTTDYLVDEDGEKVFCIGPIFGAHLHAFENIQAWQIEQSKIGVIDINIDKLPSFIEADEKEIVDLFQKMKIQSQIVYTKDFKLSKRGKRKFIIQNLPD